MSIEKLRRLLVVQDIGSVQRLVLLRCDSVLIFNSRLSPSIRINRVEESLVVY